MMLKVHVGIEDRMARAGELLSTLLPGERVHRVPGGHKWAPWRALWEKVLKSGTLGDPDSGRGASPTSKSPPEPAEQTE